MSGRGRAERLVLLTGASSGLGYETALHLAEGGFRVVATARNEERLRELERAAADRGLPLDAARIDITDSAGIQSALDAIVARHGVPYALINNAGVQMAGCFEDLDPDEIRRVFETNVFGTQAMTRAVLPLMRRSGGGRILIVTSIGGRIGTSAMSAYCSSKFALEGFGESLALETAGFGVLVSLLEPAIIKTAIWEENLTFGRRAHDPSSPYADLFQRSLELADWALRTTPTSAQDFATAVVRALNAKRPKLRYVIGGRAAAVLALRRALPFELFERIYFGQIVRRIAPRPRS